MNGKSFAIIIGVVVVLVAGIFMFRRGSQKADLQTEMTPEISTAVTDSPSPTASVAQGPVKTFNVTGKSFSFDPKEIKVNKGDTVKIVFSNTEGLHDWVIDEFNVRTPRTQAGQTTTIQFVAVKSGTFQYYCSVGSHRAQGMWGNLIVQ